MNTSTKILNTLLGLCLTAGLALAGNPELPVNLNSAGDFVILGKSGISTVPPSDITGDMGVSPIDSTAITGFALIMDLSGEFSTSAQVDGKIYAADYSVPTPTKMTTAISDMETAYTNAAGRTIPDTLNTGAIAGGDKDIGGLTFTPGLHKWDTGGVQVSANVTLDALGDPGAVFIFQIEGDLTVASGQQVVLAGNAQAGNIFWQVKGGAGAVIGTTAHFEGILLTAAKIDVLTGASFNGKLLAQTAVNLQQNTIVNKNALPDYTLTYTAGLGGSVTGVSPQTVLEGEDGTEVTAVADPGFVFIGWTGTDPSLDNPRTDLNVMADITVEAQFEAIEYTLTYTAGLGGSVTGVSPQTVLEGEDGTMVTAVADPGFAFIGWTGTDPSIVNPRTDLNVMADITVEAQFQPLAPDEYIFTYTAGVGGSISGIPLQVVLAGNDGTQVTPVAAPGYSFVEWTGTHPSTDNPRTDLNATEDITVQAQFVADPLSCGILISLGALLENDLSGNFTGTGLTYTAVSSDPAVMTASITPDNLLRTEALSTGSVLITVTATKPGMVNQVLPLSIQVVGNPTTVSSAFLPFEPWNPRFTQEITVRNDETCDAIGIRLLFSDLEDGIVVENQNGTAPIPDGREAISMAFPFPSGASVDLSVVYLSSGAFRPDQDPPTIEIQFIMADTPLPPEAGPTLMINRIQTLTDGRVFLEFASVPGTHYQIEYMNDYPTGDWNTVALDLLAGGNLTQWIDQGPPATSPMSGVRVYRVRANTP
ncbi:MAG: ice-binding family protein [Kiritimatiellae bacterium]|jgi:hypothetical protein|nr:ice-binding family protein [Kiritimatiellia bacterium]